MGTPSATPKDVSHEDEREGHTAFVADQENRIIAARRGLRGLLGRLVRQLSPDALAVQCRLVQRSGLFDRAYYRLTYPYASRPKLEPLVEYLLRGGFDGRRPNPLFDSAYYLATNADVRESGENPLVHYIRVGEREGRKPNPVFDPIAYRESHPALAAGALALAHYLVAEGQGAQGDMRAHRSPLQYVLALVSRRKRKALRLKMKSGGWFAGAGKSFAFTPDAALKRDPHRIADETGHYYLTAPPPDYCYVPPAPPPDLAARIAALARRPRFSVVVPLYNTPPDLLFRAVASVKAQWYNEWELILVDDCSPRPQVREALATLDDPRIITVLLDANSGISGATNAGIRRAGGDYLVFLDHDDELTADCLYELACCIAREDADFIYSDEDKLTEDGRFVEPFFKPDWSPDTLMSLMYTCHVSCMRRTLVEEVGLLRPEFDGSQDWDLALRVSEKARRIRHIPKVLYHWRMIPGSAAAEFNAKPAALDAAVRLRVEAMERRGIPGEIERLERLQAYFRVKYHPQGTPRISIIIPSKNNGTVLRQCLTSIRERSTYKAVEIVLVDNGTTDPATLAYIDEVAAAGGVVVRHPHPFNFSALCNIGAQAASGDLLLFLNDDTEVLTPDWLERMAGYAQLSHVGAVGAKLLYPGTETVQHVGVINLASGPSHAFLGLPRHKGGYFARAVLDYDWLAVTGACLMLERETFDRIGGFDENFPVAYNDVDLCYRLVKAGLFNVSCAGVELVHHESLSRGLDHQSPEKATRLKQDQFRLDTMHPEFYLRDPFFNPNLAPFDVHMRVSQ